MLCRGEYRSQEGELSGFSVVGVLEGPIHFSVRLGVNTVSRLARDIEYEIEGQL